MPIMGKSGKPKKSELPSTLRRSSAKAQRTFAEAHDSAVEQYGEGERAYRTAYAALKYSFEKVGDRWEAKGERGPSDSRAESPRGRSGTSAGGVDANASREHLYRLAQRLDIPGRSTMNKADLVDAIQQANEKETREGRGG